MSEVTLLGALLALGIAIFLIIVGIPASYSMLFGALVGGIVGGAGLSGTLSIMVGGASGMTSAILRIIAAGVLAGVLMGSGAASTIAETIVKKLGEANSLIALTISTFILTGIGVFGDVSVLTVSPIGIQIGKKTKVSKLAILFAMIGGVKGGQLASPNPNTIAAAEPFNVPLTSLMLAGVIPGIAVAIATIILSRTLINKGNLFGEHEEEVILENKPGLFASIIGPIVSISLLVLRPIAGIEIDPIIALPVGGIVGCLAMGKYKDFISLSTLGLDKMSSVVLLLLGTGTISGIISNSSIQEVVIGFVEHVGLPGFMLAPIAGITMGAATASATAGSSVGGNIFGESILASGVAPLQAAQMIYTGTIWFDSLPHGSFFHVSCGSVNMKIKQRLKLLPYELLIGIAGSIVSVLLYGVIGLNF
ncbi:GntP family permease [Anaerococcus sp. AGMB00486]|uniref:GntP family permease n=1 Tax=Anaerococcus faecalis TaxID=2742993 RepID=A0ABX2NCI6_9FIRM|nr:GntP family permease [Anaerococcus faecalis]NVF12409.1 GntP family permease [Anaerococcus faecalis]